jgi:hypothetical protein
MGREADEYARKVREIRKRAEKAAEEYLAVWRTPDRVCIKKGTKVVHLTHNEADGVAKSILSRRRAG